ncbi:ChaN family lipoprotein [Leptobacterium sp. I13]|uniref:ChaN family lipoprotein n=1 Tax=Leptobacterium meishanense TaxID=3128904 RepID=UPI0030EDEA46
MLKHTKITILLVVIFSFSSIKAQTKAPYKIYNDKGQKTSYKKMLKDFSKADIILFGELHNNAIAHWLEYEITYDLSQENKIILGAEMFETDNQEAIEKYLNGTIDEKAFDTLARLWKNYKTDYKPLVDFAKTKQLKFIATNVPRKYASLVFKKGFDVLGSLSMEEKKRIAPLPISYDPNLPSYKAMLEMMPGHGGENLPKAQAIKDATMAHFIIENVKQGTIFIHYNGAYHSNDYEGIYWYLKKQMPDMNIKTINVVEQENINKVEEDHLNSADYIIVVDIDMTKTY